MKAGKPMAMPFSSRVCRAISFFRRNLPPKKKRTPKNPVRVVFVCPEGGTSSRLAQYFSEALEKNGIRAVVASSTGIYGKLGGLYPCGKAMPEQKAGKALLNADIISHSFHSPGSISRLMELAPGCIITGPSYYKTGTDFSPLIELIKKNFKLRK